MRGIVTAIVKGCDRGAAQRLPTWAMEDTILPQRKVTGLVEAPRNALFLCRKFGYTGFTLSRSSGFRGLSDSAVGLLQRPRRYGAKPATIRALRGSKDQSPKET